MKKSLKHVIAASALVATVLGGSAGIANATNLGGLGIDAFSVQLLSPYKSGTRAKGKAHVHEYCSTHRTYVRYCNWHTTVERSSWRGYQTVSGSKINKRKGWQYPTGTMLSGSYDYKTHFHGTAQIKGSCYSTISGAGKKWPINGTGRVCWLSGTWTADSRKSRLRR